MDSLKAQYRQIIETILQEYANYISGEEGIQQELIFDREKDHYLLLETGWQKQKRIYGPFLHLDIIDNKVWIQHDGTEDGIAYELESAGIPKDHIVLAFKSPERRKLTEYAVS
ncbi:MAG: XisI protein [Scytolyngbya sp. HA4215-MV1]|nr:XisI protein [Scytolyngbya sp. HA4215-MV1]